MIKNRWLVSSSDIGNSITQKTAGEHRSKSCWIWQSSSSLRITGLLIWICVVWRANRDAKLELVTLDARPAWYLYTPMFFMLLTWNSNLTHIYQAKFARKVSIKWSNSPLLWLYVCVCMKLSCSWLFIQLMGRKLHKPTLTLQWNCSITQ